MGPGSPRFYAKLPCHAKLTLTGWRYACNQQVDVLVFHLLAVWCQSGSASLQSILPRSHRFVRHSNDIARRVKVPKPVIQLPPWYCLQDRLATNHAKYASLGHKYNCHRRAGQHRCYRHYGAGDYKDNDLAEAWTI